MISFVNRYMYPTKPAELVKCTILKNLFNIIKPCQIYQFLCTTCKPVTIVCFTIHEQCIQMEMEPNKKFSH